MVAYLVNVLKIKIPHTPPLFKGKYNPERKPAGVFAAAR